MTLHTEVWLVGYVSWLLGFGVGNLERKSWLLLFSIACAYGLALLIAAKMVADGR